MSNCEKCYWTKAKTFRSITSRDNWRTVFRDGILKCSLFPDSVSIDIARTKCDKGFQKKDFKLLLNKDICWKCCLQRREDFVEENFAEKNFEHFWSRGMLHCRFQFRIKGINKLAKSRQEMSQCPYVLEHLMSV